jgi:UDP-N-acetylglucosamine--N-acetylmuramyl-(pentapeptide) pyrophosphoryl-undecaprenol N-acetylglucosamine transferase
MFPAEAFATAMKARGYRIALLTDARGRRYTEGFPADWIEETPAATLGGLNPLKNLKAGLTILKGVADARHKLRALRPVLAAGFGGYPSFPGLSAARQLKVPVILHEQNAVLGRANRVFARTAALVASGFDRLDRLPQGLRREVVGNPVREAFVRLKDVPYPSVTPGGTLRLLVTGGSQGAKLFGTIVPPAIARLERVLRARIEIAQQVREDQLEATAHLYRDAGVRADLRPFFTDMPQRLAAAHLVIARAGASTVSELGVMGRPGVLIPLGIAMDDHQTANAEAMAASGAADVIAEPAFTVERLAEVLEVRLNDGPGLVHRAAAARTLGRPDAAERLADLAEAVIARGHG